MKETELFDIPNPSIILVGPTCSGKTTVAKHLEGIGYKRIITYTTRPMRDNEVNGKDYHFITEEEFKNRVEADFFLEYRDYDAEFGHCFYGSSKESYEESQPWVAILHPVNLDGMRNLYPKAMVIYLKPTLDVITSRSKYRGDDSREVTRRFFSDYYSFVELEAMAKYDLVVLDHERSPRKLVETLTAKFDILKLKNQDPNEYMNLTMTVL